MGGFGSALSPAPGIERAAGGSATARVQSLLGKRHPRELRDEVDAERLDRAREESRRDGGGGRNSKVRERPCERRRVGAGVLSLGVCEGVFQEEPAREEQLQVHEIPGFDPVEESADLVSYDLAWRVHTDAAEDQRVGNLRSAVHDPRPDPPTSSRTRGSP